MKFKITFNPKLKDKIEKDLKKQKALLINFTKSRRGRLLSLVSRKSAMRSPLVMDINFKFISDRELILETFMSGEGSFIRESAIVDVIKKNCNYGSGTKIEVIK